MPYAGRGAWRQLVRGARAAMASGEQRRPASLGLYQPALVDVCVVGAVRTPIGGLLGSLARLPAPALGSAAIAGALAASRLAPSDVDEVFMGNVLSAGLGQAPARQAALGAGLPPSVDCTTVNKVCASGLKAVTLAAQTIQTGANDVVVAGGMESMSNVPHYVAGARRGLRLGSGELADGLLVDGLTCALTGGLPHMGELAEAAAAAAGVGRDRQDAHALASHAKAAAPGAAAARAAGEVVPVSVPPARAGGPPTVVTSDDAPSRLDEARLLTLPPAFPAGAPTPAAASVTAGNASPVSDGAAALVLTSSSAAAAFGCRVMGHIVAFADAGVAPADYPHAPAAAARAALARAGLTPPDVDLWEVNEAFSVVDLLTQDALGLDSARVNVHGGAVALGHPVGASGATIVVRLLHAMAARGAAVGVAVVCNGGGGASALVVRRAPRPDGEPDRAAVAAGRRSKV